MSSVERVRIFSKKHTVAIGIISLLYILGAANLASRRAPWNDEGWFADPAHTLLTKGYMGSPIIHPRGTWLGGELTGIDTHTYWIMPGFPLLQAVWYRVVGFGLMQMRTMSIIAGLFVIWSWAFLICKLTSNYVASWITAGMLATDLTFLYSASDGRMDMTTAAFGSLGLVVYLWSRTRHLVVSLIAANTLVAAGMLCHPNGVIYAILLLLFVIKYDARALRFRHVLCLAPYVVFAAAWGIYILQQPAYFMAQFAANAHPPFGSRTAGLRHPLSMLGQEVTGRYLEHFGGSSVWAQLPPLTRIVPFFYWGCLIWLLAQSALKKNGTHMFIAVCGMATFLFMGVFVALKGGYYLVAILPIYAAGVALTVSPVYGRCARLPLSLATIVLVAQGCCFFNALQHNDYRDEYIRVVTYLKQHASPQTPITGSPALLFALPTYHLTSDSRLHEPAEYIVVDRWSRFDWAVVYRNYEPETAARVQKTLTVYDQVFDGGGWTILHRRNS